MLVVMLLMIPVWWNVIRHRRVFAGTGKMKTVVDIRNHINDAIQDMRYGYDTLPEDNLSKAAELLQGDDDVLVITTEQRKNIYLKGSVGARYAVGSAMKIKIRLKLRYGM